MDNAEPKYSKHVCMTKRGPLGISSDPVADIIAALNDPDVMRMVRELSKEELCSPWPDGAYGMDEKRVSATIRKMKDANIVMARTEGADHVYFLNEKHLRLVETFIQDLFRA